jgi:hypothetical protein
LQIVIILLRFAIRWTVELSQLSSSNAGGFCSHFFVSHNLAVPVLTPNNLPVTGGGVIFPHTIVGQLALWQCILIQAMAHLL